MNNLLQKIHGYNIYQNFQHTNYSIKNLGWNVNYDLFKLLINQTQPENILELGSWYGASAICIGNIIKELNLNTKIVCVDTWLGSKEFIGLHETDISRQLLPTFGYPNAYYQFLANICHYGLQDIVIPFPQTTKTACKWLKQNSRMFDLIYVDASNDTSDVYDDILYSWPLLKDNGIVFGDDYNNPDWLSINIGFNKFCANQGVKPTFIKEFPQHWTIQKQKQIKNQKLILVTCTYNHTNRISYIKYLIKNIISKLNDYIWILVEDNDSINSELSELLYQSNINYKYLFYGPTRSGGNAQRNFALEYIFDSNINGIVYSVDDDNLYNLKLFDEIRQTKNLSIFPVGGWGRDENNPEKPILNENHEFIGWNSSWQRKYATDMAGFAFHTDLLHKISKPFWTYISHGGGESEFIDRLVPNINNIEFNLCNFNSECYVYHNALRDIQHPDIDSLPVHISKNRIYDTKYGHSDDSQETYDIIKQILIDQYNKDQIKEILIKLEEVYQNTDGCYGGPDRIEIASIIKNISNIKDESTILELGCWKGRVSVILNLFKENCVDLISIDNFHSEDGAKIDSKKYDLVKEAFLSTMLQFNINNYKLLDKNIELIDWSILDLKPISYIYYDITMESNMGLQVIISLMPFMTKYCKIEFHDSSWLNTMQIIETLCNKYNFQKMYKINIWEGSLVIQRN
jgi:hypothetical protein